MLRFALLIFALLALPLKAATVTNLYQAQVVLPDTDKQSEKKAREEALEQVLIKVSGQSAITQNEVIRKAVANNSPYISQFGYGSLDGQQTLELTFDRARIRNLLTQASSTLWGEQRPNVLVWMVNEANRSRDIVWDQSGNAFDPQLKSAADSRGVPVLMPIGDFEDVTAINIPDLWGGFVQPIASASARYQPDAILVVRVRQQADETVQLGWQLFADKPEYLTTSRTAPAEGRSAGGSAQALTDMMNQVADFLAEKYAVQLGGASEGHFAIQVDNIQSTEDFFALERMLTNMTSVASANASKLQGNKVFFGINLLSSESAFKRELGQDRRLSQNTVTDYSVLASADSGAVNEGLYQAEGQEMTTEQVSGQVPEQAPEQLSGLQEQQAVDVSATIEPAQSQSNQYSWHP
ncbi:DUF2066 domain-containing protein [Photobacterium sp. SDRW27]|uniref:DUF2066 domain-containing protein n=1 Tax=Photobacterium obscurum TaxID=2829490 RepID=UPI0022437B6D|nr:DUF2066 domain-containing protein [Photobacterium obscurum]MCW8331773.1 DUF2066 domain-containing protein [Photobacterium obscurum]